MASDPYTPLRLEPSITAGADSKGERKPSLALEIVPVLRIMPSQVVEWIDSTFPMFAGEKTGKPSGISISFDHKFEVASLVDLVDSIPENLLTLDAGYAGRLISATAILRSAVKTWETIPRHPSSAVSGRPQFDGFHPVTAIRQALSTCPDEAPSTVTRGLEFIKDRGIRESIRLDISAANIDLGNGESKSATVMAGSAMEALLLWALEENTKPVDRTSAGQALIADGRLSKKPGPNLDRWDLAQFIEVAAHLNIIDTDTATQARLAQNYRNLIHPGRAIRLGQTCDRGTALSAVAAVELINRDLSQRYT